MGARSLSASGRELFTIDNFRDTGRPLLELMADQDSIFIKVKFFMTIKILLKGSIAITVIAIPLYQVTH